MTTGNFENFAGEIAEIGPMYPFVGSEGLLVVVGLVFWIAWHIWQTIHESKTYDEDSSAARKHISQTMK